MKRTITRTSSPMATTVITYRAPRSYRRCGDNLIDTRGARYVAVRGDRAIRNANYVAVRGGDAYYRPSRTRYIATERYAAVRRPVYRDSGTRYVAVREGSRDRLVPVSQIADVYDDDIQYVKVRRAPVYREQVAYYEAPRTRYVAVRSINSGCARAVALRGCSGQVGTMSTRRVVLRDDDDDAAYSTGTKYVTVRERIEEDDYDRDAVDASAYDTDVDTDDDDYVAPAAMSTTYIDDDDDYLAAREVETQFVRQPAVRTYPETYNTRTISYAPVSSYYNDDIDDQAFLDGGGAAYVAYDDVEDACLRPTAVYEEPVAMSTQEVRYVPADDVDDYAFHSGSAETYVEVRRPVSRVSYAPAVSVREVSYVPVDDTEYIDAGPVEYVAADEAVDAGTGYVSYVAADEYCPMDVRYAAEGPVYVAETPTTVLVEEVDSSMAFLSPAAQRIARTLGFNEGYEDGLDDAQDGDDFEPSDTGAQGYKREYGDKDVYRGAFRSAYLEGYQAGFKALDAAL